MVELPDFSLIIIASIIIFLVSIIFTNLMEMKKLRESISIRIAKLENERTHNERDIHKMKDKIDSLEPYIVLHKQFMDKIMEFGMESIKKYSIQENSDDDRRE
jgi:hypothetical protein